MIRLSPDFMSLKWKKIVGCAGLTLSLATLSSCSIKVKSKAQKGSAGGIEGNLEKMAGDGSGLPLLKPQISMVGLHFGSYEVRAAWPPLYDDVRVFVNDLLVFKSTSRTTSHCYFGVVHDSEHRIVIEGHPLGAFATQAVGQAGPKSAGFSEPVLLLDQTIKAPKDVDLNAWSDQGLQAAHSSLWAHRVFILGDRPVYTQGHSIVINTEELIAVEGFLRSFPEDQKASRDQEGRAGGSVTIRAKQARGNLQIVMAGEHGGDGTDGPPYTERAPKGAKGQSGVVRTRSLRSREHSALVDFCSRPPTGGQPGAPGLPGRDGQPGKRGGDTGILRLEIAQESPEFVFKYHKQRGQAGQPGEGGPPQLGGEGGDPGDQDSDRVCPGAPPGSEGPSSTVYGQRGVQEPDGNEQTECISMGEGFGRCSEWVH